MGHEDISKNGNCYGKRKPASCLDKQLDVPISLSETYSILSVSASCVYLSEGWVDYTPYPRYVPRGCNCFVCVDTVPDVDHSLHNMQIHKS